jgi:hypothetical protein
MSKEKLVNRLYYLNELSKMEEISLGYVKESTEEEIDEILILLDECE